MPSLSELRAELKELRKANLGERPLSRMTNKDISEQIQGLRRMREETPAPAATPSTPAEKTRRAPAVESIKEAKASEFPTAPSRGMAAAPKKNGKAPAAAQ